MTRRIVFDAVKNPTQRVDVDSLQVLLTSLAKALSAELYDVAEPGCWPGMFFTLYYTYQASCIVAAGT